VDTQDDFGIYFCPGNLWRLNTKVGTMTRMLNALVLVLVLLCVPAAWARTDEAYLKHFIEVEALSGVNARLLWAVAATESSHNAQAMNNSHLARTKSYDIGLMQINSSHLPTLKKFGITESDLRQPRTSIEVAAWLLRELFRIHGQTWEAVGAYNAACVQLKGEACRNARDTYIGKVKNHLRRAPDMNTELPSLDNTPPTASDQPQRPTITTLAFN
jgi:hypothetical protein